MPLNPWNSVPVQNLLVFVSDGKLSNDYDMVTVAVPRLTSLSWFMDRQLLDCLEHSQNKPTEQWFCFNDITANISSSFIGH